MQSTERERWRAYAKIGALLVLPRTEHMIITVVMFLYAIALLAPPLFMWEKAITIWSTLNAGQFGVAVALAMMATSREESRVVADSKVNMMDWIGRDTFAFGVAIGAALLSALYGVFNIAFFLAPCSSSHTEVNLCSWVFNTTTTTTTASCTTTDINTLWRRTGFANQLIAFQACNDDFVITIVWTVLAFLGVLLDAMVIYYITTLRPRTAFVNEIMAREEKLQ